MKKTLKEKMLSEGIMKLLNIILITLGSSVFTLPFFIFGQTNNGVYITTAYLQNFIIFVFIVFIITFLIYEDNNNKTKEN